MMTRINYLAIAARTSLANFVSKKSKGIDGVLIAIGLAILGILLIGFFKDEIFTTIKTEITALKEKISGIVSAQT